MLKDNIVWTKEDRFEVIEIKGTLILEFSQGVSKQYSYNSKIDIEEEIKNKIAKVMWHKLYGEIYADLQDIYCETNGNENIRNLLKRIENI